MPLRSEAFEIGSWAEWARFAVEQRWTDGLPVYPPTEDGISAFLDYIRRDPGEEIGEVAPRQGVATIEKVAINCVMAGCRPEHMPVVLAALEALLEEPFNLPGVQTTTNMVEPLTIVSGPVVRELGFATQETVFGGGGSAVNASIGRAIRLILWNIGGGYPGEPCKKTFGHPGRFCFLVAEDVEHSPWPPMHTDYGIPAERSAVTVFACEPPHSVITLRSDYTPTSYLKIIADHMSAPGSNNSTESAGGEIFVGLTAYGAEIMSKNGWSREAVKRYLFEVARRPLKELKPYKPGMTEPRNWWATWPTWVDQGNMDTMCPVAWDAACIHVAVTGRYDKGWSVVCPGWGAEGGLAVSKPIIKPGEDRKAVMADVKHIPRARFT